MALSGALLLGTANNKVEAASNTPSTYTVKAGDTLWGISHKYGVSLNKIEALNNKSSLIYVGEKMKLTGAYTYTAPVVQTKVNYNASILLRETPYLCEIPHNVSPALTVYVLGVFVAASTLLFVVPNNKAPERATAATNVLCIKIISLLSNYILVSVINMNIV